MNSKSIFIAAVTCISLLSFSAEAFFNWNSKVVFPDESALREELHANNDFFYTELAKKLGGKRLDPFQVADTVSQCVIDYCSHKPELCKTMGHLRHAVYEELLAKRSPNALKELEQHGIYQPYKCRS